MNGLADRSDIRHDITLPATAPTTAPSSTLAPASTPTGGYDSSDKRQVMTDSGSQGRGRNWVIFNLHILDSCW